MGEAYGQSIALDGGQTTWKRTRVRVRGVLQFPWPKKKKKKGFQILETLLRGVDAGMAVRLREGNDDAFLWNKDEVA